MRLTERLIMHVLAKVELFANRAARFGINRPEGAAPAAPGRGTTPPEPAHAELLEFIKTSKKTTAASPEEVAVCINIDLFSV